MYMTLEDDILLRIDNAFHCSIPFAAQDKYIQLTSTLIAVQAFDKTRHFCQIQVKLSFFAQDLTQQL
jgi:hypothetical protein